jgi:hypothetical protein
MDPIGSAKCHSQFSRQFPIIFQSIFDRVRSLKNNGELGIENGTVPKQQIKIGRRWLK